MFSWMLSFLFSFEVVHVVHVYYKSQSEIIEKQFRQNMIRIFKLFLSCFALLNSAILFFLYLKLPLKLLCGKEMCLLESNYDMIKGYSKNRLKKYEFIILIQNFPIWWPFKQGGQTCWWPFDVYCFTSSPSLSTTHNTTDILLKVALSFHESCKSKLMSLYLC